VIEPGNTLHGVSVTLRNYVEVGFRAV
jgi:hypothetical protein